MEAQEGEKLTAETNLNYSKELLARLRDIRITGKANEVNMVRKKSHDFEGTEEKTQKMKTMQVSEFHVVDYRSPLRGQVLSSE